MSLSTIYLVDYYANSLDSPMHRASVTVKMISTIMALGCIILNKSLLSLVLQLFLIIGFQAASKLPIRRLLLWAIYPTIFGALFALSQAQYSIELSIQTLLRAVDAALLMLLLINTTPYAKIIPLIGKFSKTISNLAFFSYRFFFLFIDESEKRLTAFRVRGGLLGPLGTKIRNIAKLIGLLFVSYMESGEKVYYAVKTRGYRGMFSTETVAGREMTRDDYVPILLALFSVVILVVGIVGHSLS
jgi:cobalt/nickel transport system permease protein